MSAPGHGYTLIICEKPDVAEKVSEALAEQGMERIYMRGSVIYRFRRGGADYVVCPAQGHLYGISDPLDERSVYPVFDVEWYPSNLIDEGESKVSGKIAAIKSLAPGASAIVNACDFDLEGETIGFNIIRYACGNNGRPVLRAKFSTLTKTELVRAFDDVKVQTRYGLARAGRARHLIDFVWGVNLSRVLSQIPMNTGGRFRTISMGRVQGPTLSFIAKRELEIRCFVPVPYWRITGIFSNSQDRFTAAYSKPRLSSKAESEKIVAECSGKRGRVASLRRETLRLNPPPAFNIGNLQKEAYRILGYNPGRTSKLAERLYLNALISYPRTGSQKLPRSINYRRILAGLSRVGLYSKYVDELAKGQLKPVQGPGDDPAHPAIYPTGEAPRGSLDRSATAVFDLIVRRFLATFAPPAVRDHKEAEIQVGTHRFLVEGGRTLDPGWMKYYGQRAHTKDEEFPNLAEADNLRVEMISSSEKFQERPTRYNQGSLLDKMERENLGTKATRADIIGTLVARGYVAGDNLEVSDLGFSVTETMQNYAPEIVTTTLTRDIENRLEEVESQEVGEKDIVRETVRSITMNLIALKENESGVESAIGVSLRSSIPSMEILGRCPVCKSGNLRIIRSRRTKKRFVGCSNYSSGCRASAPVPQRGKLVAAKKECEHCSWPLVYVSYGRRPWRLCVNLSCPGKMNRSR